MHIAKTVRSITTQENALVRTIMDTFVVLDQGFVDQILSLTQFTWHGRRPLSGFKTDGSPRAHDLDLLSVMVELMRRRAYVRLPGYTNMLPWEIAAGEQHVGTDRYGKIRRLISHREHLSFSVQINDRSVIRHADAKAGALRTYAMVGYNGDWNPGWRGVKWKHSADEAEFFAKRRLLQNGELTFRYYVHPNRRQSYGGAPYLLLKLLWQRFEHEVDHYAAELKRLESLGVHRPLDIDAPGKHIIAKGKSRNAFVRRFVMRLEGLHFTGQYPSVTADEAGYRQAYKRRQLIIEQLQPVVQFVVRADEAAFYLYGMASGFVPNWIRGPKWTKDPKGKWTRLAIADGVSLTYFTDEVPKKVAA